MSQSFPTQHDDYQDTTVTGWGAGVPLNYPEPNSYPAAPPHTLRRMRWAFLGPNPMEIGILQELLETFDNDIYHGLILTAYRTTQLHFIEWMHHLLTHRVKGYIEIRTLSPDFDFEISIRRSVVSGERFISSFLSIPVDALGTRWTSFDVITLQNLEVVHILPPSGDSLATQESLDVCLRTLTDTLFWARGLLKSILPLDLFDHLEGCLEIIAHFNTVKELELTAPLNNDSPFRPATAFNFAISPLLPSLLRLTHLHTFCIPAVSLVEPNVLVEMARFPALRVCKLKLPPVPTFNPIKFMVEALTAAGITSRGPNCFGHLEVLDVGPCDSDRPYFEESIYSEIFDYVLELDRILPNTLCICESRTYHASSLDLDDRLRTDVCTFTQIGCITLP